MPGPQSGSATVPPSRRLLAWAAHPPGWAILGACALVLALRRNQAFTVPQFWAEDIYFYQRAYVLGWRAFLESYAGYLDLIPRIIAHVAACADPHLAPAIFVWSAGLSTLYVAGRALSRRCPLPQFAGLCALALVLVPDTYEVLLNLVNLQWVLGAGLVLLLLSDDPRGRLQWSHDLIAALALGLTGPFGIVLLPLFAWRLWSRRTSASAWLAAIVAACALVQVYCLVVEPRPPVDSHGGSDLALVLPAIAQRVGGSILMGSLLGRGSNLPVGTIVGLATLVGVVTLACRPGAFRTERTLLGCVFFLLVAAGFVRTRHALDLFFVPHADGRYVYLPQLAAIWLLIASAACNDRIGRISAALAVWALIVNVPRLREPAYVDMNWSAYVDKLQAGQPVTIPTNPPGWFMRLAPRRP